MDSHKISNEFYKKLGSEWLSKIAQVRDDDDELNLILKLSRKSDTILDLACGYGRLTIPLAKKGYEITGIDLSPELIKDARKTARENNLKIKFTIGSMTNLPYANNSFNKIFCMWSSFNHLLEEKEQLKCINEVYRVLKPDGLALFEMTNGEKKATKRKLEINKKGKYNRVLVDNIDGVTNTAYIHDRNTLKEIGKNSKFANYTVKFMNLNKKRRLIMILNK